MSDSQDSRHLELTAELGQWELTLVSGDVVSVRAHGYSVEGDDFVFVALMEGTPCFEVEIARFPASCVKAVDGG